MKKTRIIIPALAMIAFSVAASITGTVAWFTANRTAQIDAGTYAVVKTTSDLTCTVENVVGTTATNSASTHTIAVNGKLSDASFDHVGSNHYIYEPDSGLTIKKRTALASASASNMSRGQIPISSTESVEVYTAIIWKVTFTLDFSATSSTDIGLFLDLSQSKFTPSDETVASGNKDTAKAFRMAFIPEAASTNGVTRVFADLQTATNCTYVGGEPGEGTELPSGTAYVAPALIDSSSNAAPAASYDATTAAAQTFYLGKFAYQSNTAVSLSYKVVCWFEGTDENIVNSTSTTTVIFRDVTAELHFAAKNFTA